MVLLFFFKFWKQNIKMLFDQLSEDEKDGEDPSDSAKSKKRRRKKKKIEEETSSQVNIAVEFEVHF